MPKVSIVMPCYNDGKYIKESINSVKKQTYTDWELIIINDGSDDVLTNNILNGIKENNIRVINTNQQGPAAARNRGIMEATGTYILPLDSDDIIYSTYIEKAVAIIEADANIGIVYCEAEFFGEKSGKWDLPMYNLGRMLHNNIIFVSALFRKKDWETTGGYNENLKIGIEDYDFWLSIIGLNRKVYRIPEVLFKYRIKEKSRNNIFYKDKELVFNTLMYIFDSHKQLYIDNIEEVILEFRKSEYKRDKIIEKIKEHIPFYSILTRNSKSKKYLEKIFFDKN